MLEIILELKNTIQNILFILILYLQLIRIVLEGIIWDKFSKIILTPLSLNHAIIY